MSLRNHRDIRTEEMFDKDDWICKSHIPIIFSGTFDNEITVSTIIRNPVDAIASNSFRWSNGHTGNIVQGRVVIDKAQIRKENDLDDDLKRLIDHQIKQYISYLFCYLNAPSKIMAFKYEDVQNRIAWCIDNITNNYNNLDYNSAQYTIDNPPQPTKEKTQLYFEIRKYIQESPLYAEACIRYNAALNVLQKQSFYKN